MHGSLVPHALPPINWHCLATQVLTNSLFDTLRSMAPLMTSSEPSSEPSVGGKVVAVCGDVSKDNLGMEVSLMMRVFARDSNTGPTASWHSIIQPAGTASCTTHTYVHTTLSAHTLQVLLDTLAYYALHYIPTDE